MRRPAPTPPPFPLLTDKQRADIATATRGLFTYKERGLQTMRYFQLVPGSKPREIYPEQVRSILTERGMTSERLHERNTNSLLDYAFLFLAIYKALDPYA